MRHFTRDPVDVPDLLERDKTRAADAENPARGRCLRRIPSSIGTALTRTRSRSARPSGTLSSRGATAKAHSPKAHERTDAAMSTTQLDVFASAFKEAASTRLHLDEWVERYRVIVGGAHSGRWNPRHGVMSVEPMRAVSTRRGQPGDRGGADAAAQDGILYQCGALDGVLRRRRIVRPSRTSRSSRRWSRIGYGRRWRLLARSTCWASTVRSERSGTHGLSYVSVAAARSRA